MNLFHGLEWTKEFPEGWGTCIIIIIMHKSSIHSKSYNNRKPYILETLTVSTKFNIHITGCRMIEVLYLCAHGSVVGGSFSLRLQRVRKACIPHMWEPSFRKSRTGRVRLCSSVFLIFVVNRLSWKRQESKTQLSWESEWCSYRISLFVECFPVKVLGGALWLANLASNHGLSPLCGFDSHRWPHWEPGC